MQLNGKTALVTGGTDGIGAHLIRQLRAKGVTVITCGRNPQKIAAARADGFEVIEADLSGPGGVSALIKGLGDRPLDLLINNAGSGVDYDFRTGAEPDLDDVDSVIYLNFVAPIHIITRLLPRLRARGKATIVNVTSGLAIAPRAGGPIYCATKAGLRSYTQAVREQLKGTGVHLIEALPPVVDTQMTAMRTSKKMPPEECAAQIIDAVVSDADEANVGMVKLLQLLHSISPAMARKVMLKF